jgi:hypothetical protein
LLNLNQRIWVSWRFPRLRRYCANELVGVVDWPRSWDSNPNHHLYLLCWRNNGLESPLKESPFFVDKILGRMLNIKM